jgi:hypothetical protein
MGLKITKNKGAICIGLSCMFISLASLITSYISYVDMYSHDLLLFGTGMFFVIGMGLITGEMKIEIKK